MPLRQRELLKSFPLPSSREDKEEATGFPPCLVQKKTDATIHSLRSSEFPPSPPPHPRPHPPSPHPPPDTLSDVSSKRCVQLPPPGSSLCGYTPTVLHPRPPSPSSRSQRGGGGRGQGRKRGMGLETDRQTETDANKNKQRDQEERVVGTPSPLLPAAVAERACGTAKMRVLKGSGERVCVCGFCCCCVVVFCLLLLQNEENKIKAKEEGLSLSLKKIYAEATYCWAVSPCVRDSEWGWVGGWVAWCLCVWDLPF